MPYSVTPAVLSAKVAVAPRKMARLCSSILADSAGLKPGLADDEISSLAAGGAGFDLAFAFLPQNANRSSRSSKKSRVPQSGVNSCQIVAGRNTQERSCPWME